MGKITDIWKENLAESLKIPRDLAFQDAVITLTGDAEILLENYRGILEYSQTQILVQTNHCRIRIQGEKLEVLYYTNDEMKVSGKFSGISYER